MFTIPTITAAAQNQLRCNQIMTDYNDSVMAALSRFKNQWTNFWMSGLPVDQMQSQLDFMASISITDLGQPVTGLAAYLAKSQRLTAFLTAELSTAFADGKMESTGQLQPNGQPYQQFLTPGWYYTVDAGRIVLSAPCTWAN